MTIIVHIVSPDMAAMLAEMHAECFGAARWSSGQMQGSLRLETTRGWLALADQEPAGFLLCQQSGNEREILTFCVHPRHRRKGIGETLLRAMLDELPCGGVSYLEVAADNEAARLLYKKCGFVPVNTRKGYYRREEGLADAISYHYEKR